MEDLKLQITELNNLFTRLNTQLKIDVIFQLYSPMSIKLRESLSKIINQIGNVSWTGEYFHTYVEGEYSEKRTDTIGIQQVKKNIMTCDGTIIQTDHNVPNIYMFGGMNLYMINDYLIDICGKKDIDDLNMIVPRSGDYDFKIHLNKKYVFVEDDDDDNLSNHPEIENILKQIMSIISDTLSQNIPTESPSTQFMIDAINILSDVTKTEMAICELDTSDLKADIIKIDPSIRHVMPINNYMFASISEFRVQINIKTRVNGIEHIEHICEFLLSRLTPDTAYFPIIPMYFASDDIRWSIPMQTPNYSRLYDLLKAIINRSWGKSKLGTIGGGAAASPAAIAAAGAAPPKNLEYKPESRCIKDIQRFYWLYKLYKQNILPEPNGLDQYKEIVDLSIEKCKKWKTIASRDEIGNIHTKFRNIESYLIQEISFKQAEAQKQKNKLNKK